MLVMRELTVMGVFIRILTAVVLGGVIGMERGMKNRPAGLRTYMLVCIGACVVMLINQYIYQIYGTGDPVRMGAQVISGIGFLGAGTIIVTPHNQIKGLTTAAGLWSAACIGLAIGIGFYEAAAAGSLAVFFVLAVLNRWDYSVKHSLHMSEIYVELDRTVSLREFLQNIRERDLELNNIQVLHEGEISEEALAFTATLKARKKSDSQDVMRQIRKIEGVLYIEEL